MAAIAWFLLLVAITQATPSNISENEEKHHEDKSCTDTAEMAAEFRRAHFDFTIKMYKATAIHNCKTRNLKTPHYTYSANNVWITLAAIAEGSEGEARKELFHVLNLPHEECRRKAFHQFALQREQSGLDIDLDVNRVLAADESIHIDEDWKKTAATNHGMQVTRVPLKSNPAKAALKMRHIICSGLEHINRTGNSILLNSLDFEGLWKTAFPDSVDEKVAFHDDSGRHVGYVDMMRTKLYARMGYIKSIRSKVIELPIGENGRYSIMISLSLNETSMSEVISAMNPHLLPEVLKHLRQSRVPIEIALPRFTIDTEHDMREVLESIGLRALWKNPSDTCKISKPSAFPTSYVQRASITLETAGVNAVQEVPEDVELEDDCDPFTGLHPAVGVDFIADKPISFAVFDSETFTTVVAGVYSIPTYGLHS